jgi:hypothetical protein
VIPLKPQAGEALGTQTTYTLVGIITLGIKRRLWKMKREVNFLMMA